MSAACATRVPTATLIPPNVRTMSNASRSVVSSPRYTGMRLANAPSRMSCVRPEPLECARGLISSTRLPRNSAHCGAWLRNIVSIDCSRSALPVLSSATCSAIAIPALSSMMRTSLRRASAPTSARRRSGKVAASTCTGSPARMRYCAPCSPTAGSFTGCSSRSIASTERPLTMPSAPPSRASSSESSAIRARSSRTASGWDSNSTSVPSMSSNRAIDASGASTARA